MQDPGPTASSVTVRRGTARWQPGPLAGFRFSSWVRLLRENRWDVDREYLPRAVVATAGAAASSLLAPVDAWLARRPVDEEALARPLFVLGLPRSGTTLLFELLSLDPGFCFPTMLDAFNPHTFLLLHALGVDRLLGRVRPKRRFMDAVTTNWGSPFEDEFALAASTRRGPAVALAFPRGEVDRRGEAILSAAPSEARRCFREALSDFVRKLVLLHGRPVLLKSPAHIARIPDILAVFPRARFVTIFRDPAAQWSSFRAMDRASDGDWCALNRRESADRATRETDSRDRGSVRRILTEYFATRDLVPPGRLVEIRYEDLAADPGAVLGRVYAELDLPGRDAVCARIRDHLASRPAYRVNARPRPRDEDVALLREIYRPIWDRGVYPMP